MTERDYAIKSFKEITLNAKRHTEQRMDVWKQQIEWEVIIVTKKNPNKFTIGFKKNNVSHQKVVEILNNTEDKADFIASAVLYYLGEGKGTDSLNPDKSSLLPLIRTIVKKEIQEAIS